MTFEEFWAQYPKKVARKDAQKMWNRLSDTDKAAAMSALPKHVAAWNERGELQYVPHAATWINGERWTDEVQCAAPPKQALAWWLSDKGVEAKGREIGVHARPGEDMAAYKARVVEAMRRAA